MSPSSLSVSGPGVGEGTGLELTGCAGNWILLEVPKKTNKGGIFGSCESEIIIILNKEV